MKRIAFLFLLLIASSSVFGMHIAEGFLPMKWSIIWTLVFIPFLILGFKNVKKLVLENPKLKLLYAVAGAFVFVLSSLKIPSVGGSSSHLTGIALGAILFGASGMYVIGLIVLLFQALLLAHGGLTTLGANAFSMSVIGAVTAVAIYKLGVFFKTPKNINIFFAAFLSNIAVYITTSFQLAIAFQSETSSFWDNMIKFSSIFIVAQLPLAVLEGILTSICIKLILKYSQSEINLYNPSI